MTYGNAKGTENECINERHLIVNGDNMILRDNWQTVRDRM